MTLAMIMAGGQSSRMRPSGAGKHKALMRVLGVPLLERNLCTLIAAGFEDIVIAISAAEPSLLDYVETRCQELAHARGSSVRCWVESDPHGTIGAARAFLAETSELVVVNVDNLTTLDLQAMLEHHRRVGASMTIAVHWEPFLIPYGEVSLEGGWVKGLEEKPVKRFQTSSGTYVLSRDAAMVFPKSGPVGGPELFERLRETGKLVAGFEHSSRWIDINDAEAVARAEHLILADGHDHADPRGVSDRAVTALLVHGPGGVLLERRESDSSRYPGLWDLPDCCVMEGDGERPQHFMRRLQLSSDSVPKRLLSFDDLDTHSGEFIRHHVFEVPWPDNAAAAGLGEWVAPNRDLHTGAVSPPARRAIAALMARRPATAREARNQRAIDEIPVEIEH